MLMAMLLNPPIAQFGFEWLLQADSNFSKQSIKDVKNILVEFLVNVFKDKFLQKLIQEDEAMEEQQREEETCDLRDDEDDFFATFSRNNNNKKNNTDEENEDEEKN